MRIIKIFIILLLGTFFISTNSQTTDSARMNQKNTTIQNLKDAIKGEATSSAKYKAYSIKAKEEGHNELAVLFDAAAKSESIHEKNYRAVLVKLGEKMEEFKPVFEVKSTVENLEDAVKEETYEVEKMYPKFIKSSDDDTFSDASVSIDYAYKTEVKHMNFFQNALSMLDEGKENKLPVSYYVCTTCGNTIDNYAVNKCGISQTLKEKFLVIEL